MNSIAARVTPPPRQKVLFVLPSATVGGVEQHVLRLLEVIPSRDFAILTQTALKKLYQGRVDELYCFDDYGCHHPDDVRPGNMFRYARAVAQAGRETGADILLGMTFTGDIAAALARLLGYRRGRFVGTMATHLSALLKSARRTPTRLELAWLRFCFVMADGFIVPSAAVATDLIEVFGAPKAKVTVIYNGVDAERIIAASREPLPFPKTRPWIVTSCRLDPQKDFDTLLRAFAKVRASQAAQLLIIGDGSLRERIQELARTLGVQENVTLAGFLANPFPVMGQADVFVLSSHYEGFGWVIVEAMALGAPVVASDAPAGPREILRDGRDGFLTPVGDSDAMAAAISRLLADASERQRWAEAGRRRVADFSAASMGAAYERHFDDLRATR